VNLTLILSASLSSSTVPSLPQPSPHPSASLHSQCSFSSDPKTSQAKAAHSFPDFCHLSLTPLVLFPSQRLRRKKGG